MAGIKPRNQRRTPPIAEDMKTYSYQAALTNMQDRMRFLEPTYWLIPDGIQYVWLYDRAVEAGRAFTN